MAVQDVIDSLNALDLDQLHAEAMADVRSGKKTRRQAAVKKLRAIEGLKRYGVTPQDLLVKRVPVIPAAFRPYSAAGDTFIPGDANELYSDLHKAVQAYKETKDELGEEGAEDTASYLRSAVNAVYGYDDSPNPKIRNRRVSGFLEKILGSNPKVSFVQSKLLAKTQDFVGRGVITPNPDLGMDEVAIPKEMAWTLADPHLQRNLVAQGIPTSRAMAMIKERHPTAQKVLEKVMRDIPVIYSRSPAWHAQNVISGYARIADGDNIEVSPLTTAGYSGDFDGDAHENQVVVAVNNTLPLQTGWTILDISGISNPVLQKLLIPLQVAGLRVIITDLADFPRSDRRYSKEGENGPIHFYDVPEDTKVVAFDESSQELVWAPVSTYSEHPGRVLEIVSLTNRRQIFTDNDPRAVYGVDPSDPELRLQRFTPTEALARRVAVPVAKNTKALIDPSAREVTIGDHTIPLSYGLGYLLGSLCGDGWWDKKDHDYYRQRRLFDDTRAIQLSDLGGFCAKACEEYIKALFKQERIYVFKQAHNKEEHPDRYGDTVKYTFGFPGSGDFAAWLSLHLGGERCDKSSGAANKRLPAVFYTAPEEFRRGLLAGLIDTDGTCSVSHGKGKPQLMISFTSTSLRLARETQALCRTLGVSSAVSFSKTTSGGNTSWIVTISAVDCKREDLLAGLRNPTKRENFLNTPINGKGGSEMRDAVIFPGHISSHLRSWLYVPKHRPEDLGLATSAIKRRKQQRNIYLQLMKAADKGIITRYLLSEIEGELRKLRAEADRDLITGARALEVSGQDGYFSQERSDAVRQAIRSVSPKQDTPERYAEGCKVAARVNQPLRKGKISSAMAAGIRTWLRETAQVASPLTDTAYVSWRKLFVDAPVEWASVEKVDYTGELFDGYDLTVPGYETFMAVDGVILSNTMSVHWPAMPESIKDAKEKLLPSIQAFSVRNRDETLPVPKHEQLLGLAGSQLVPSGTIHRVANQAEALAGITSGKIKLQDQVEIGPDPMQGLGSQILGSVMES